MDEQPKMSLKAARINAGMKQDEAARAIGIDQGTLRRLEQGKTKPRVDVMDRIERVYGIKAKYIRLE